jgi:hypothetical protein
MKTIIIFLATMLCIACFRKQSNTFTHEVLLVDITDTVDRVLKEDLAAYGQPAREEGMCLSLGYITDVYRNPKETICIDSFESGLTADVLSRDKAVADFQKERSRLFGQLDSVGYGCSESQIFRAVCRELTYLAQKDDQSVKRLVVFSNLFENTRVFSVFRSADQRKLKDPESLALFFAETYHVPERLDGITIEIRYQPTLETEALHDRMIELYREVFEVRGCTLINHVEHITNIN